MSLQAANRDLLFPETLKHPRENIVKIKTLIHRADQALSSSSMSKYSCERPGDAFPGTRQKMLGEHGRLGLRITVPADRRMHLRCDSDLSCQLYGVIVGSCCRSNE